eukprot:TRINITY_DN45626_c0_g1_i1.p1 TRINITY_DN45626_c0_g1~~TRINITY_DN45626_c0_g1_i1.p1  ORF type:complete len:244 (-),score=51.55 TRINITY_DN45626_c0_g1_i1:96-749(-)
MPKPTAADSDYKKMGMGEANLYLVYAAFGQVFALPGIVGACVALFGVKSEAARGKVETLAAAGAGPLYLGWWFLKLLTTQVAASLGTSRRSTGVNVPDQHVYKIVDGSAEGSMVLMDDSAANGRFNRAQRAYTNLVSEVIPPFLGDFLLAGFVFPWTTALLTSAFGCFRLKGALDYADERTKRMTGNMTANICASGLAGIVLTSGAYATYLELKKKA